MLALCTLLLYVVSLKMLFSHFLSGLIIFVIIGKLVHIVTCYKLLPAKVNQLAMRFPGHCIAALHAASKPRAPYAACAINSNAINSTGLGHVLPSCS